MKKILVINGVNLNMLGVREPGIYGSSTLEDLENTITQKSKEIPCSVDFFQSNIEGEICTKIQDALGVYDGIIINPGAFTHYSYAIRDAISSVKIPTVEVHISNIHKREDIRKKSVMAEFCKGQICGLGFFGYDCALEALVNGQ